MKKHLRWLIVAAIVVVIGGVIAFKKWPAYFSAPTELQGSYVLLRAINKQANGRIELVAFTQLGGEYTEGSDPKTLQPVKVYVMPYEFTVKFREDCRWGLFGQVGGTNFWQNDFYTYAPGGLERYPKYDDQALREGRKDATTTIRGRLHFYQEKGRWTGHMVGLGIPQ